MINIAIHDADIDTVVGIIRTNASLEQVTEINNTCTISEEDYDNFNCSSIVHAIKENGFTAEIIKIDAEIDW